MSGRGRDTGVAWGVAAVLCIGTVLYAWLGHPTATDRAVFGRPGSLAVLVVALLAAVAGLVVAAARQGPSAGLRRGVAIPVAVVAVGVIVVAAGSLLAPKHATDFVAGVLLLAGAVAMEVVAVRVGRRRLPRG
ncbi:hypothetical protein GCM10009835_30410 [Planosporangium flavigriseum]